MIIVLAGTNWEPLKTELDRLVDDFVTKHGDLAVEKVDLEEAEGQSLLSAVEAQPFLSDKKLVVATKLSAQKDATDIFAKLVERDSDSTDTIIVEDTLDKRGAYYKSLKKLSHFKEFDELDQASAGRWALQYVQSNDGTISPKDANYVVERIGANQTLLTRELDKLIAYNPKITKNTIDELTEATPQTTSFNLVDHVFSGQTDYAIKIYEQQRMQKVEPQAIIGMFAWQLHVLAVVSCAPRDKSDQAIATDAGINPYVIGKSRRLTRDLSLADIRKALASLRKIDRDSKTKSINIDDALKYFILTLSN